MCYHAWVVVVIDTSVFVSALLGPGGASRAVLRECLEGPLQPLMGNALFAEFEDVLSRRALFSRAALDAVQREALLNAFLSMCRWTRIYYLWRPNLRDEADNHVVELAVAGGAEAIVTKNIRDFRGTELRFSGLRVFRPEELLKELPS